MGNCSVIFRAILYDLYDLFRLLSFMLNKHFYNFYICVYRLFNR